MRKQDIYYYHVVYFHLDSCISKLSVSFVAFCILYISQYYSEKGPAVSPDFEGLCAWSSAQTLPRGIAQRFPLQPDPPALQGRFKAALQTQGPMFQMP